MTSRRSSFGPLTKRDLTAFDQEATDLILEAIELGCTGRVSTKGHCIIRNNSGETTAVPRNLSTLNRGSQNAKAQIRRLLNRSF